MPYSLSSNHGNSVRVNQMINGVPRTHYKPVTIDLPWVKPRDVTIPLTTVIEGAIQRVFRRAPITNLLLCEKPPTKLVQLVESGAQTCDVIQAENLWATSAIHAIGGPPRVATLHDVYSDRMGELLKYFGASQNTVCKVLNRVLTLEKKLIPSLDATVFVSEEDLERYRRLGVEPPNPHIIPNGVDTKRFRPLPKNPNMLAQYGLPVDKKLIMFSGSDMYQNREAVDYIIGVSKKMRDPQVEFVIAGSVSTYAKAKAKKMGAKIMVLGFVPNLVGVYSLCDAYFAPLRSGTGTKLKILEAMASGKPVVTTREALRGLKVENECVVVSGVEEAVDALLELILDKDKAASLSQKARQKAEEYDWGILFPTYFKLYSEIC
ncbi:MAG: glycosyltransferase family 4 protein [Thermoprotei archaeon]